MKIDFVDHGGTFYLTWRSFQQRPHMKLESDDFVFGRTALGKSSAIPRHLNHLPPQKPQRRQWNPFPRQVGSFDGRHGIMRHGLFGAHQPIGIGAHLLVAPVAVIQGGGAGTENLGHAAFAPHGRHHGPERILIPATDWNKRHHARISAKSRGPGSSS